MSKMTFSKKSGKCLKKRGYKFNDVIKIFTILLASNSPNTFSTAK